MTIIRFFFFLSLFFYSSDLFSQSLRATDSGLVVDFSGVFSVFFGEHPKPRTTDGSNSTLGSNSSSNLSSQQINTTIYPVLELFQSDNQVGSTWFSAVTYCEKLKVDGGSWRLPTQRELTLFWLFQSHLNSSSTFSPLLGHYWSSTESSATGSWSILFPLGENYPSNKIKQCRVRCVRDVPMGKGR